MNWGNKILDWIGLGFFGAMGALVLIELAHRFLHTTGVCNL